MPEDPPTLQHVRNLIYTNAPSTIDFNFNIVLSGCDGFTDDPFNQNNRDLFRIGLSLRKADAPGYPVDDSMKISLVAVKTIDQYYSSTGFIIWGRNRMFEYIAVHELGHQIASLNHPYGNHAYEHVDPFFYPDQYDHCLMHNVGEGDSLGLLISIIRDGEFCRVPSLPCDTSCAFFLRIATGFNPDSCQWWSY